jgi:lysophospholipase L1-like esterase
MASKIIPLFLAFLLAACGGGGSSTPAPAPNQPPAVVQITAYGDSTQLAQGNPHAANRAGWSIENKGIGSSTTTQWLAKWDTELTATSATIVIYNGGINDGDLTLEQYKAALREMVRIARVHKKQLMLEQPNNATAKPGFDLAAFNDRRAAMGPLASAEGVYFCAQPDVPLFDNVHPTAEGYATKAVKLAKCIADAL